jgi:ABC-type transport system substrate-binding protein
MATKKKGTSETVNRARLSRRSFLGGALTATGAAGLVLAGCGGGGEEKAGTPQAAGTVTGEPKRGGTIRYPVTTPVLSLDPNTTEGVSVAPYLYSYVVQPTDWHKPDETIGDLAESWETPTEVDWIFHLRGDAIFQDLPPASGRPVVAEDIIKSIDRYRGMPGASTAWDQWTERYAAPDPRTFTILTKKPYGYLLMDLGSPLTAIMPIEAVEEFGDLKSHAIGSGPFMVKTYERNQGLQVVRNPTYYHDYPYIDEFDIKVLPDEASIQAAFRAGSLDVYMATDKLKADTVRSVGGTSIQTFLDRIYTVFELNATRVEAFKDARVREAIDLALDRQAMIDRLYFGDAELAGPVPPLWPAALPKEEVAQAYQRDVGKAKQLLSAAGHENLSFVLNFGNYSNVADLAAIIKSNLADAGITANLEPGELGSWLANLTAGNFESTAFIHLRYLSDYIQINWHHSHGWARTEQGYLGVDDDAVDSMLDQINGTIDLQARIKLEQDAQRLILKRHGPTLVLYEPYGYWCSYDYIKGYTPTAYGFGLYKYDFWIDKG